MGDGIPRSDHCGHTRNQKPVLQMEGRLRGEVNQIRNGVRSCIGIQIGETRNRSRLKKTRRERGERRASLIPKRCIGPHKTTTRQTDRTPKPFRRSRLMSRMTERQLARHFFHIKSSTENVSDVEGSELGSVAEALLEAEHCARDLWHVPSLQTPSHRPKSSFKMKIDRSWEDWT